MPRAKRTTKTKPYDNIQGWDVYIPILFAKLSNLKNAIKNIFAAILHLIWDSPVLKALNHAIRQNKQFIIIMIFLLTIKTGLNLKETGNVYGTQYELARDTHIKFASKRNQTKHKVGSDGLVHETNDPDDFTKHVSIKIKNRKGGYMKSVYCHEPDRLLENSGKNISNGIIFLFSGTDLNATRWIHSGIFEALYNGSYHVIAVDLPGEGYAYDTDAAVMQKNHWETFAREWMVAMKPVFGEHNLTMVGFGTAGKV